MWNARDAIAVYRGWHNLEQVLSPENPVEIIDFDLVADAPEPVHFASRQQVTERLVGLRDSLADEDETTEFIRAKLNASLHYIRSLEGEQSEFYQHVQLILGKTPELVSEEDVAQQQTRVYDLLERFGVLFRNGQPTPDGFTTFDKSLALTSEEATAQEGEFRAKLLPLVKELLGFRDLEVRYRFQPANENAYWRAWSSGTRDEFLLRYNFHPLQHWRRGDIEYLTLHEVCGHFVHAANLARRIEEEVDGERKLDPFIGVTTVHDPHGFMGEGLADALTYFFPDEVIPQSAEAHLAGEHTRWRDYLNNNAHVLVNMGWPDWMLLGYLLRSPFNEPERARLNLDRWRTNPLWRAYQYSYGISLKYHRSFARRMTPEQKITYLRYGLTRYVTPRRLIEYAERLIEQR